jgi:hypothetical protein
MTEAKESRTKGRPRNLAPLFEIGKLQAIADAFAEYQASNLKPFNEITPKLHEMLRTLARQNVSDIQMSVILSRATEMPIAAGCSVGDLMEHLKRYQAAARSKAKGKEQKKEAGADGDPELSENNKSKDSGTLGSEGDGDPPDDNPNASKSGNGMTDPTQQNAGVEAVNLILQRNLSPIPAGEANRPIVDASTAEGREPG